MDACVNITVRLCGSQLNTLHRGEVFAEGGQTGSWHNAYRAVATINIESTGTDKLELSSGDDIVNTNWKHFHIGPMSCSVTSIAVKSSFCALHKKLRTNIE